MKIRETYEMLKAIGAYSYLEKEGEAALQNYNEGKAQEFPLKEMENSQHAAYDLLETMIQEHGLDDYNIGMTFEDGGKIYGHVVIDSVLTRGDFKQELHPYKLSFHELDPIDPTGTTIDLFQFPEDASNIKDAMKEALSVLFTAEDRIKERVRLPEPRKRNRDDQER